MQFRVYYTILYRITVHLLDKKCQLPALGTLHFLASFDFQMSAFLRSRIVGYPSFLIRFLAGARADGSPSSKPHVFLKRDRNGRERYFLKTGCLLARDGRTDGSLELAGVEKYLPYPPNTKLGPGCLKHAETMVSKYMKDLDTAQQHAVSDSESSSSGSSSAQRKPQALSPPLSAQQQRSTRNGPLNVPETLPETPIP